MHITTTEELIDAIKDTADELATESPGEEEDLYDALAAALRKLAANLERNAKRDRKETR